MEHHAPQNKDEVNQTTNGEKSAEYLDPCIVPQPSGDSDKLIENDQETFELNSPTTPRSQEQVIVDQNVRAENTERHGSIKFTESSGSASKGRPFAVGSLISAILVLLFLGSAATGFGTVFFLIMAFLSLIAAIILINIHIKRLKHPKTESVSDESGSRTDPFALTSFLMLVAAILFCIPVIVLSSMGGLILIAAILSLCSMIFALVAQSRIRKSPDRWKGKALAMISFYGNGLVLFILLIVMLVYVLMGAFNSLLDFSVGGG